MVEVEGVLENIPTELDLWGVETWYIPSEELEDVAQGLDIWADSG